MAIHRKLRPKYQLLMMSLKLTPMKPPMAVVSYPKISFFIRQKPLMEILLQSYRSQAAVLRQVSTHQRGSELCVCPITSLPPRGNEDRGANHYVGATWSSWLHMGLHTQEGNGMENTNRPSSIESER